VDFYLQRKNSKGWNQRNGKARSILLKMAVLWVQRWPIHQILSIYPTSTAITLELELLVNNNDFGYSEFRSLSLPDYQQGRVHGYQMEVDPSSGASRWYLRRGSSRLALRPEQNPATSRRSGTGQWNEICRIEAYRKCIGTWVNGVPSATSGG
jgi:hypothetical protein